MCSPYIQQEPECQSVTPTRTQTAGPREAAIAAAGDVCVRQKSRCAGTQIPHAKKQAIHFPLFHNSKNLKSSASKCPQLFVECSLKLCGDSVGRHHGYSCSKFGPVLTCDEHTSDNTMADKTAPVVEDKEKEKEKEVDVSKPMEYRFLGRSGLRVSVLSFGFVLQADPLYQIESDPAIINKSVGHCWWSGQIDNTFTNVPKQPYMGCNFSTMRRSTLQAKRRQQWAKF